MFDLASFPEVLLSNTFTFLVGPSQVRVTIHKHVFKGVSDPLHNLINNGQISESATGEAVLDDVDVAPFLALCEFAYARNYLSLIHQTKQEWQPPRPDAAGQSRSNIAAFHRWEKAFEDELAKKQDLNRRKAPKFRVSAGLKLLAADSRRLDRVAVYDELSKAFHNLKFNIKAPDTGKATLLLHAKVADLAARYLAADAADLAMSYLHAGLCAFDIGSFEAIDAVLSVLQYVYIGGDLPGPDPSSSEEEVAKAQDPYDDSSETSLCRTRSNEEKVPRSLRMLVSRFVACRVQMLMLDKRFCRLLRSSSEMGADILDWYCGRIRFVSIENESDKPIKEHTVEKGRGIKKYKPIY